MKIHSVLDTVIMSACSYAMFGSAAAFADFAQQVPEPGSLSILGLGAGALYLISRRNRRK